MENIGNKDAVELIVALRDAAKAIRTLEAEGREALYSGDDKALYDKKMVEKAMVLLEMPDVVEPFLDGLPAGEAKKIAHRAENFARRAGMALDLPSVFFMASLLYPDNYREGDKNDLERFISGLEQRFGVMP